MRKSGRCSSNVSPNNGLNGLPRRSQFDAKADTANPTKNMVLLYDSILFENYTLLPAIYFILSMGSSCSEAIRINRAYSMYSVIRCRKLSGSLKMTGIVILLNSFPMQFFNTDHMLKSLHENMGTGNEVLQLKQLTQSMLVQFYIIIFLPCNIE